jgi:hypothetical protein
MRGLRFPQQRIALEVGLEHDIDKAVGTVGRFLRKTAHTPPRSNRDGAGFGR